MSKLAVGDIVIKKLDDELLDLDTLGEVVEILESSDPDTYKTVWVKHFTSVKPCFTGNRDIYFEKELFKPDDYYLEYLKKLNPWMWNYHTNFGRVRVRGYKLK